MRHYFWRTERHQEHAGEDDPPISSRKGVATQSGVVQAVQFALSELEEDETLTLDVEPVGVALSGE